METKTIESIQARIEADEEYQEDLEAYDAMFNMRWELPSGWEKKEWVRKKVSTDAHDAIRTATNIYDTNNPKWEVLPRGLADKDAAEQLETFLEWIMARANKAGEHEPFRKSLHNSCLQNRVIYQLDYLPYWLPKDKKSWNKEQKAAMKASSYCIIVHDARNVYFEFGKYGLKWAASVTVMPAQDVIDHWSVYESDSKEGKKIKSAISRMKSELADDSELKYIHVDYTSHDKREVSVFPTTSDTLESFEDYDAESDDKIDILDAKNELGFINWVVVTGESTPLLYSVHKAGLWENQNIYDTIVDSTIMRRAVFPILKHTSPTGKELEIDYSGEQDVIELTNGEDAQTVVPPPIDGAMVQITAGNTAKTAQATGIKGLASIEIAGNVQYAAVQAVIKLHMTSLVPYVRTVEKANAQLADLAFQWLQQGDGYTEIAYRTKDKGDGKEKGLGFTVSPTDFEPEDLYISCQLIANTPTDRMQEVNMYAQLKQAGAHIGWKEVLEKLSLGNGDVLEAEWLDEEVQTVALQMKVKELDAQIQLMMSKEQMELQMQGQQIQMQMQQQQMAQMQGQGNMAQPQGQAPADQSNPMIPNGQGSNAAMGGQSTGVPMPGATSPMGA